MTIESLAFWKSEKTAPIVARVAIAGDFLPAGELSLPPGGWSAAAAAIAPVFDDVNVSFMNLECPLDVQGLSSRPLNGIGTIVSAASISLEYLAALRSRAVGIANNHAYDFAGGGVERTRAALAARDLIPIGAGRTLRDAPEVFVWHGPGDVCVGFWAAARASRDLATRSNPGVEPATAARARLASAALKLKGATFAIALLHCGCLRTNRLDPSDAALLDEIASCGFDLVAASHSHRISGAKRLPTRHAAPSFCFYGLGSIVSGFIASPLERQGLVVVAGLHADGALASLEVHPVWLAHSGLAEASAPYARAVLDHFLHLTAEISEGTSARHFYEDVSPGLFPLYARDLRAAFQQSGMLGLARKARRIRGHHLRRLLHGLTS
jgi:poly-gamma-glutamate capsule biosynthesis protein CapA/YwtB (metallophosphatase superfamily)